MFQSLKNHPFAVEAFFDYSLVLSFAIPKEQIKPLIPECLELDTFQNKWAFIAVALVQTKGLRPKGFPAFLGQDFLLIGYRVFVHYHTNAGKRLRGLYILKSETNKKQMTFTGNIFTHYKYTTTDIHICKSDRYLHIHSMASKFTIGAIIQTSEDFSLPDQSPFSNWQEARRFAGPLPFTFTYDAFKKEVLIIEGVRENWTPKPIEIKKYDFNFLTQLNLNDICLANAFIIHNIPYYWRKGKIELWKS
jgi:uncharacterized protein YqjF (DUF2071 family)